ncbi:MAG: sulfite exporter TauE/SafE family protein [Deltaproteobacteria bacterium]|nr:sulfite exporter TauE/SafE family protein [Deltaproteobacteria bacterium]
MELHFPLIHYLLVCAVGLVMGIFGAILGSTLFVLVPLLNFLGLPLHAAIGTAKLSVIGREIGPILLFSRSGALRPRLVVPFTLAAVLCAHLGALWATSMDELVLKKVVGLSMLAISLITLWKKETGLAEAAIDLTWKQDLLNLACGILIGLYTGLFGAGTNILIIFVLVYLGGNSFLQAVATSKIPNLIICIASLPAFIVKDFVNWELGIPLTLATALGSQIGARVALRGGSRLIRFLFLALVLSVAIAYLIR